MKRLVVKVGTSVISDEKGGVDQKILENIIEQVVATRKKGIEVILITSGAVGTGKSLVSLKDIKSEVVRKQVFAAVGQVKLMATYADMFGKHGYLCAQVLATKEDFRDEEHYSNMKNCFEALLLDNVVPVVNENDVVAITELMFTDNDELAALIAQQLAADVVIILTSTEGLLDGQGNTVSKIDAKNADEAVKYISPDKSAEGRGGMLTKFNIARELSKKGIGVYIVNGKSSSSLSDVVDGKVNGTHFVSLKI